MQTYQVAVLRSQIHPQAVENFKDRKRKDFNAYKRLNAGQLDDILRRMRVVPPPLYKKLKLHQKACFVIGVRTCKFAYFMDTGTGKTLLSIVLGQYFRQARIARRFLVLTLGLANKYEWEREIEKHAASTPYCVLEGSSKQKWQQIDENPDALFVIETFGGMVRMVCDRQPKKRGGKKKELVPNKKRVEELCRLFDGVISDEGTLAGLASIDTLPFRICRKMTRTESTRVLFELTGTPFGRDVTALWPQLYIIDQGWTLGETLGLFRATFFKETRNLLGGIDLNFDKRLQPLLHRYIAAASIRYEADEADLPKVTRVQKHVSLPEDAALYYERARQAVIKAGGNFREMKNAFIRMRQISSGFVGFYDDDEGKKAQFEFAENPKLDLLVSLIETIRHKVIVFYDFTFSSLRIAEELKYATGIRPLHIYGDTPDVQHALRLFNDDPERRVLLLQNRLGAGLNLQVAKYGIYYESPVPWIVRRQTERRIERQYSEHDVVFLYDLLCRGTVDMKILEFHHEGADLMKSVLNGQTRL